jgi:predicted NUDIX family phosphoesterase
MMFGQIIIINRNQFFKKEFLDWSGFLIILARPMKPEWVDETIGWNNSKENG